MKGKLLISLALTLPASASAQIQFSGSTTTFTGVEPRGLYIGYVNGDTAIDVGYTASSGSPERSIRFNFGVIDGWFGSGTTQGMPPGSSPHTFIPWGSNSNGQFATMTSLEGSNEVKFDTSVFGGGPANGPSSSVGGVGPRQMVGIEMTGDGVRDLVLNLYGSNAITVLANQGPHQFGSLGLIPAGSDLRDMLVADYDQDGDSDVAIVSNGDRTVRVFMNPGDGQLIAGPTLNLLGTGYANGLDQGDLNGDGLLDLIATTGDDSALAENQVQIFWGQTGGGFSTAVAFPLGLLGAYDVAAADLSRSGLLDLAVYCGVSKDVVTLENLGSGQYAPAQALGYSLSTQSNTGELVAGDVDNNGSVDLSVMDSITSIYHLLNARNGTPDLGTNYCPAVPNEQGGVAEISSTGSISAVDNFVVLTVDSLPTTFGYFICSQTQGFVPGAGGNVGNLCLGGDIDRLNQTVYQSGGALGLATKFVVAPIDLTQMATPFGPVSAVAGETWNFQFWYRDFTPITFQPTTNFSDGYSITFQ